MPEILLHLEYLLQNHACVILPRLGAFISSRESARLDEATSVILPPTRHVSFNASISNDDGLLASSVARRLGIPFERARTLVSEDVQSIYEALRADGALLIPRIGTLSLAEERLVFAPIASLGSGRAPLTLLPLEEAVSKQSDTPATRQREKRYYHLRIRKSLVHYAASLLLLVGIALSWVLLAPQPQMHEQQQASVVPLPAMTPEIAEPMPKAPAALQQTDYPYHLIVATFRSLQEAESFIASHRDKGFELEIIPSKTLQRVSAASSADTGSLRAIMTQPSFTQAFPQAWIYND